MQFYQNSASAVLADLGSTREGLPDNEILLRRKTYGKNIIHTEKTAWWRTLLEPFMDAFMVILSGAAIISFMRGETLDGIIIFAIIAASAIIFYIQRFSTERVLRSLNQQTIEHVTVRRSGRILKILSTELVPGDIVLVSEGEKIPADLRIVDSTHLRVDESVLTGESLPVDKIPAALTGQRQIYEQSNMLFSGSFVISGTGLGVVVATGNATEFGTIATLSQRTETKSPVQLKIDTFINKIVLIVVALACVAFGLALMRGMSIAESLSFVIALSVSAVPEGLPIAISVALVLGMRRMAAKKVLVHQMRAIETLGVITTIATDKTGTLTENKLAIHETWHPKHTKDFNHTIGRVFNHAATTDPLDAAIMKYARTHNALPQHHSPAHELPFDQAASLSATIWHHGTDFQVYLKGAPETILHHSSLDSAELKTAQTALKRLTKKGYRVIAIATAAHHTLPESIATVLTHSVTFEGFIAAADTIRPEVPAAIKTALAAGVTVRMITGDHAETAYQIGKQIDMVQRRREVFDCRELDALTDAQLTPIIARTKIFARVIPSQKHRLLSLLKQHNITAMTGDGVNDVPALTNAHVGIAMNSGTHIAKDAGDIVLLDDNFKTIIDAMREGRAIIANIRRMLFYLISTNAGEVLTMLGALIIGMRPPLEAVQILWVNLVTDTSMVIPLGLEPAEEGIMQQKPLKPNAPIMNRTMVIRTILIALTIATLTLTAYLVFSEQFGRDYAQTAAFITLVASQWGSAFAARSDHTSLFTHLRVKNRSFYIGFLVSLFVQAVMLLTPVGNILHISHINVTHIILLSLVGFIVPIITSEIHKYFARRTTA